MKRFLSLILAMAIIASVFVAVPVQAANYDENSYTLTGVQMNDIIGIARTQVGYKEGNNSSQLDGTVSGNGNYTKYAKELKASGYGASNPNAWCAYFVSWCAMKAGCLNSAVYFFTGVKSCVAKSKPYKSNGLGTYHAIKKYTFTKGSVFSKDYTPSNIENYKPKKGDIMIFKTHVGLVVSDYNASTDSFSIIEGNWGGKVNNRTVKMSNSELVGFVSPDYKTTSITPTHTHSYTYANDSAHPHSEYKYCSCGAKEYTGGKDTVSSCSSCYPVGNVNLTRSFEKTKGTATFYRNTVSNADSYTLKLYKNNSLYNTYTMSNSTYYVSGLPSGSYSAVLYAKNTSTGEERRGSCDSFRIVDTYTVAYNANGGSNAPSSQTKIEDTLLTITSGIPQKEGYVFKGWAKSKNAVTPQYLSGDGYETNANITLYAVWEPEVYTVTFDANGGTGTLESKTITYGNTMKMPNSVIKEYAYLIGWSTDKNATKAEYALGVDYKVKGNLTLYAVWGNATWSNEVSDNLKGSGTEADPYLVSTAADLAYLANKVNTQTATPTYEYYKMTDNINLTYNEWVPIGIYGNENQYFYGSFDGNGYTISDLYITQPNQNYVGLFGYAKDSNINNLTVTGAIESITTENVMYLGGIVGYTNNVKLNGLSAKYFNVGGITAPGETASSVGTIVGKSENGKMEHCTSEDCSINLKSGKYNAGMIAGACVSDMADCDVISTDEGLFSVASSVDSAYIGGMCGQFLGTTAERCSVNAPYFSNNIKARASGVGLLIGGFAGWLNGEVKVCSVKFTDDTKNSMTVDGTGYVYVGGFSGAGGSDAKITDCKFDGKTVSVSTSSGNAYVGGLLGQAYAKTTPTVSVNGGQSLSYASLPKKEGYKATWYTDSDYKMPYDFSQIVTSDMTLYAKWEKGDDTPDIWDGTSSEPAYDADTKTYTITNGEELAWISDVTNGVITSGTNFPTDITFSGYTIELANDIYLNDVSDWENWDERTYLKNEWSPIGSYGSENIADIAFAGTLDGKNNTIYGLMYSYDRYSSKGLFGNSKGIIKNLNMSNAILNYINRDGVIVGYNSGVIKCCNILGKVFNGNGFVGYNYGTIQYCSNYATVYSGNGIAAENHNVIEYCFNKSNIKYGDGIVDDNYGTILYCTNEGNIYGQYSSGISDINYGTIQYCKNSGTIESVGAHSAGISGENWGNINFCYNTGYIKAGQSYAGGIVGGSHSNSFISDCYNRGDIRADWYYAGGISGFSCGATIKNTYCVAYVSAGEGDVGTIVGCVDSNSKLTNCYSNATPLYTKETSKSTPTISNVGAMDTHKMKSSLSNYAGFSSSCWKVSGYNYARLLSLEETYKIYNVTVVVDENNSCINRTFANVDGDISSMSDEVSNTGGIIGYCTYNSSPAFSVVKNVVGMADDVSATTSGSSYKAYSGNVVGNNSANKFNFENAYYNSEMNVTSSTSNIDTTGTPRSQKTMNASFYTNLLGLTPYSSLKNLESDDKAVWVLKNGELPELYYNCLNDITVSDDIENGTITVDKTQAIDGEVVTVTAIPSEGYVLNKIYVNGAEKDGTTFIVSGDSEVFATFSEKIAEYSVAVTAGENATATVANVDSAEPMPMSIGETGSQTTALTAKDGEEILVTANADEDYTVDTIYVNGEEIAGDSFILTDNTTVTMDVTSISTEIRATTDDAEDVGSYFAIVGGSIADADEETVKYIRYWSADDTQTVYTTEPETGIGTYTAELMDLNASTTYYYQMTELGEVKSFTTCAEEVDEYVGDEDDGDSGTSTSSITTTTYKTLASTYKFSIECSRALTTEFLAIACYDHAGSLLALSQITCDGDTSYTASVPIDANIDYAKIFVWRGLSDMTPLAGAEKIVIEK